jgi:cyclopropane-fatty-acyl-phospholipid synthase
MPDIDRIASSYQKRYDEYFGGGSSASFAIKAPDGSKKVFGPGEPEFTLVATDDRAMKALATIDRLVIAEAYLSGGIDIEGDIIPVLAHRNFFRDNHPMVTAWHMFWPKIHGQEKTDAEHISHHYDIDADFFLSFLDKRHRCYSHGIFQCDDESLEDGITRKLQFSLDSVEARPGDRVLDVGGGWGAFTEYAGKQDMQVTSLTISRESEKYLNDLIAREKIPCKV